MTASVHIVPTRYLTRQGLDTMRSTASSHDTETDPEHSLHPMLALPTYAVYNQIGLPAFDLPYPKRSIYLYIYNIIYIYKHTAIVVLGPNRPPLVWLLGT